MKTLKDLIFDVSAVDDYATVWKAVDYDVLRKEAIKWVKKIDEWSKKLDTKWWKEVPSEFMIEALSPEEGITHLMSIRFWIKYFFNIEESDLDE